MTPAQEKVYFAACPSPLGDVALLLLDTGLRLGEALSLEWAQVKLEPAQGAKIRVPDGLFRKSEEQEVPQRTAQQTERSYA